jgi:hypothetical protein
LKTEYVNIPLSFHLAYLFLAGIVAYLYYLKIVLPVDPGAVNSIDAVLTFQTYKPYQFRLLIPFIFLLFKTLKFIPQNILFLFYSIFVVYFIILMYRKLISEYFTNNKTLLFLAPVILYPILWNYILINGMYQYYDFTSILIFIIGLYLIIKEKFYALWGLLIIGILNKETVAYLIPAHLLFNYKLIFTKKILIRSAFLFATFIGIKVLLAFIFSNNPGDNVQLCYYENIHVIKSFLTNKVYIKHIVLNFGMLYIFVFLLFLTGRWKKFHSRKLIFVNLAFLPNLVLGFFVTYYDEVHVCRICPISTTLFLIYLNI